MDVIIPPLGESITEATVGEWLKQPGDVVAADEPIVSLETDKVAVEVNAPVAGVMGEQLAGVGDTVAVGDRIARIDEGGTSARAAPEPPKAKTEDRKVKADAPAPAARAPAEAPEPEPAEQGLPTTGPRARRLAAEGTPVATAAAAESSVQSDGSAAGRSAGVAAGAAGTRTRTEERVRMTRLRQTIARRLKEAQNTAAMLTTFNDVDMSAVMAARVHYKDLFEKKHGVRLGFMSFFVKACVLAARDVPSVNARIDGEEIVFHDYVDMGVAVSGGGGLVVPVLRNADAKSFAEIELEIADFGRRARDGQLKLEELQGGTFTISNGGVFGSLLSTPILNPPQSGVLGMHRIEERPVAVNGQVVIRPMMYLALSYDHRLVDGREAVTFLVRVKEALEDPTRLLIDL